MTFNATVVRVFLASPSDTHKEREIARKVIAQWNASHAEHNGVVLLPVGWETDAVPDLGAPPQAVLNRQLVDPADVLIGIFWTRLGTPTTDGKSGTVEEIDRFAKTGKPVLLYFCRKKADLSEVDTVQLDAVREFEAEVKPRGLFDSYGDWDEFANKLMNALVRVVRERFVREILSEENLPKGRRLQEPPKLKHEARLSAHLEDHDGRGRYRLVIANIGSLDVKNVNVQIPADATRLDLNSDDLPIEVLRSGEKVFLMAIASFGPGKSIFDVHLTGETPSGEQVSFPSKISI